MSGKSSRVVILVADGLGVGEAPDAEAYGDRGSNTLGHIADHVGGIRLPNLQRLGIGNLGNFAGIAPTTSPEALVSRMAEQSAGKDTTTGHWELAGLVTREAFSLFPEGFPPELVDEFVREANVSGILGNHHASGTQIIDELGAEHLRTGKPILYTSGDSVFQLACSEEKFGLDRLYSICEIARRITTPYRIGRVIARPFVGAGTAERPFKRTEHRRDYALPPAINALDVLKDEGVAVLSVGKIDDIFDHRGISRGNHTGNNLDSLKATLDFLEKSRRERAFIFTNLVDFDMLYGHRRDPVGYAKALVELDEFLPKILRELTSDDLVILTADHGCDPTFRGTDHTREYVPLVAFRPGTRGAHLPDRASFTDVAATVVETFGVTSQALPDIGSSFLCKFAR